MLKDSGLTEKKWFERFLKTCSVRHYPQIFKIQVKHIIC